MFLLTQSWKDLISMCFRITAQTFLWLTEEKVRPVTKCECSSVKNRNESKCHNLLILFGISAIENSAKKVYCI